MNNKQIKKHPLSELLKELESYMEEPGDPVWEKIRSDLNIKLKLNTPVINITIWKSMVFTSLYDSYNRDPQAFKERPELIGKLLTKCFDHLNEYFEGNYDIGNDLNLDEDGEEDTDNPY